MEIAGIVVCLVVVAFCVIVIVGVFKKSANRILEVFAARPQASFSIKQVALHTGRGEKEVEEFVRRLYRQGLLQLDMDSDLAKPRYRITQAGLRRLGKAPQDTTP